MQLRFLKKEALDFMKSNIESIYINYYHKKDNQWIKELFDYDPFETMNINFPDFELEKITGELGKVDLENCKIFYNNLKSLSESQATDERLWAGLCNDTFYNYVRCRWNYPNMKLKSPTDDSSMILSRFFFRGSGLRESLFRNTLSKYWWVGHAAYQKNKENQFEMLDNLGTNDFSTKVNSLFRVYSFSSNKQIASGICKAWKSVTDVDGSLSAKKYFRPALQYLNAFAGRVILDVFSDNKIKDKFLEFIKELHLNNETQSIVTDDTTVELIDENDDSTIETNENTERIQESTNESFEEKEESINSQSEESKRQGEWFDIYSKLLNKEKGDTFKFARNTYEILKIYR